MTDAEKQVYCQGLVLLNATKELLAALSSRTLSADKFAQLINNAVLATAKMDRAVMLQIDDKTKEAAV